MKISSKEKPSKIEIWILASRPKTLPAAVVPVIVGSALAIEQGIFNPLYSIIALLCSILIQIGTNFTNDLYDHLKGADKKERKGPLRVLASGLVSVKEMKFAIGFVFGLSFVFGLYLVYTSGVVILIIGILSIAAGILYTAGPYPLAYKGLGDVFVFLFFGIVGTAGTYYLYSHEFTILSLLVSVPVGALITNILVVNNYRDIDEDRAAKKYTLAVKLGKKITRYQYIISFAVSYFISLIIYVFFNFSIWIFLPLLSLPLAVKLIKMMYEYEGDQLNKTLELTAKFSLLFGLLFSTGLIL